jgi:DNA-binding MarR family transcriptional regulator
VKLALDGYIVDVLMRDLAEHEGRPSAFLVYLYLWRLTHGAERLYAVSSYQEIAERIGLSKSAAQGAVRLLKRRKLISITRRSLTSTPTYSVARPWLRRSKPS